MKPDALIVIDVQNALLEENPYQSQALMENIEKLIAACRAQLIPVIYVQHTENDGALAQGSACWQISQRIAPQQGEAIFEKRFNSAFRHTGLQAHLEKHHTRNLVLCGMQTEYCMDASIKVAFELGYTVTVPQGGTSTFDGRMFAAKDIIAFYEQDIWHGRYATITPVEALLVDLAK